MAKATGKGVVVKKARRHVQIPATSALAPMVRKGVEGVCLACQKPISAHFGHRGVWTGCQGLKVPSEAVFVLVPALLPFRKPIVVPGAAQAQDGGAKKRAPIATRMKASPMPAILPRYVYQVADRRRKLPDETSQAVKDTYNGLLKAKKPVTADQAAKLAKRPSAANRQRLNALVLSKFVTRQSVEPVSESSVRQRAA